MRKGGGRKKGGGKKEGWEREGITVEERRERIGTK